MNWQNWPSVSLSDHAQLPDKAGIYVVADANHFVWYVGQAINLQARWLGRAHHRYPQLIRSNKKLTHRIYWKTFAACQLDEKERLYIGLLKPELNGCKVKSYLPKQPQVKREIKRLLKVMNKPTLLFPVIRSAVAGAYHDEDGIECVVMMTHINDFRLLGKSLRKRYSAEVRRAWFGLKTYCGRSPDLYHELQIFSFHLPHRRFEFVESTDVLQYLECDPKIYEQSVEVIDLFGVTVKVLKDLSVLDQVTTKEEYSVLRDGKRTLKDAAYLSYIRPELYPLVETTTKKANDCREAFRP